MQESAENPQFTKGANELTNTLTGMIKGISDKPPAMDIGIINSDYSLTTNSFKRPIPKTQYSVCRSLLYRLNVPLTETYQDGIHVHGCGGPCEWPEPTGAHVHEVRLPKKMRSVRPNDKVLVAWVQNEAIVIDIIYDAKWLGDREPPWE